jgi:hypothetical protein
LIYLKSEEQNSMSDTNLDYLVSLGIIGAGVVWIVAGTNSALCIAAGAVSIAVGAMSFLNELGY